MEEAETLADYVYIIDHGHIIAKGTPSSLVSSMGQESVIEFKLSQEKDLDPPFKGAKKKEGTYIVEVKDVPGAMEKLFVWAKNNRIDISDIFIRRPNLEDLFLELTGRSLRD